MDEIQEVVREPISDDLRWKVLKRDHYACRYCGHDSGPFHIDHVYPVAEGGKSVYGNLVTACPRCNLKKHDTVGMWPLPIGYFEKGETITPNAKLGLAIFGATAALANASYFADKGMTAIAVVMFVFGIVVSMYSAARLVIGYNYDA